MDHWIPVLLHIATILVAQLIPCCFRIALESSFQDWIDWNNDERGIRKKIIIPKNNLKNNLKFKILYLSIYYSKNSNK